jgi:hypothetical protein
MAQKALNATTIWNNPALDDEEGVQTRWSTYPMSQLLLATQIDALTSHSIRGTLLDGSVVSATSQDWNLDTAKAIHRNLVRVPRWAVADGHSQTSGWLRNYVTQPAAIGWLRPDGEVLWPSRDAPTGISYDPDQGVVISRENVERRFQEESDESFD